MITFSLHGELGNQMFQWATGLAFSRKHQVPIKFLTLPDVTPRLSEFRTGRNFDIEPISLGLNPDSIFRKASRKIGFEHGLGNVQNEVGLNFQDLEFANLRNYHGYFQSWRYFHYMRDSILVEFELLNASKNFFELKNSFPEHFTAIHIRRGGPGAALLTSDYHGLLDFEYYRRAIDLNEKLGGSDNYIVFTDNPDKAGELVNQLDMRNPRIIGPRDTHSQCENLILMANARSFIGANSSYSWWAAYLNKNLQTHPIFPRQWYVNPNLSNTDMLLPDWISVGFNKFLNEKQVRGIDLE